MFNKLTLKS